MTDASALMILSLFLLLTPGIKLGVYGKRRVRRRRRCRRHDMCDESKLEGFCAKIANIELGDKCSILT